jgi:GNAT superfamily N-acetyltransferase
LEKVDFQTHGDIIGRLRVQAWRNESGIDPLFFARPSWIEVLDEDAEHWVVTDNGVAVAAARLSWHTSLADVPYAYLLPADAQQQITSQHIASISRMVVAPSHRGHGFSTLLDKVRVAEALASGAEILTGATQLNFRQKALAKLGFDTLSELRKAPERPEWPLYFMVYHAVTSSSPAAASRPV